MKSNKFLDSRYNDNTCFSTYDVSECDMFKLNLRANGINYSINVIQNDQFARFPMNIKL